MEIAKSLDSKNRWIITPAGDIDIYTSEKFKNQVMEIYEESSSDLIIDGKNLDYVDSTGLGALIHILKHLKEDKRKVYLVNIKDNIKKLLEITELDKLFIIRGGIDE